jgi:hypothetical protein
MVAERINSYISGMVGTAVCDMCIQSALALSRSQQVQATTSALATTSDFIRDRGTCGTCRKDAKVIRPTRGAVT